MSWIRLKRNGGYANGNMGCGGIVACKRGVVCCLASGNKYKERIIMLGGYKKKKKILDVAKQYVAGSQDQYEWRIYWRDMGEALKDAKKSV